jgi:hypothetical protein
MSNNSHNTPIILALLSSLGLLAGCSSPSSDTGGTGGFAVGGSGAETGTGGAPAGGATGAGGSTCSTPHSPPKTILCAGDYYESEDTGTARAAISTRAAESACLVHPYYYYPEDPYYPSTGGSTGWFPGPLGGALNGSDDLGMGGATDEPVGVGGTPVGDWPGTGGIVSGGGGGGVIIGGDGATLSDWCASAESTSYIAGASFASGPCQDTDLKMPVTFTEPYGFYRLRAFAGSTACERGTLLTEMQGYGTGALVSLPFQAPEGFVSLELTSADFTSLSLQLNAIDAPTILPRE